MLLIGKRKKAPELSGAFWVTKCQNFFNFLTETKRSEPTAKIIPEFGSGTDPGISTSLNNAGLPPLLSSHVEGVVTVRV